MECNKDEAMRAKEIAEKKFLANDISGAKKFAMKAQNLFPSLENINQMLLTLDVHLSSLADFNGEKDWYGILGTDRTADEENIRKRYRKLALQLHPDKNKSVGAEGAFQFISQAWCVLSDKHRRMIYDHKRFGDGFYPKPPTAATANATAATANATAATANATAPVKNNFPDTLNGARFNAAPKVQPKKTKKNPTNIKAATFWTSCSTCKVQYEYSRAYLNLNLMCPGCKKPFLATEIVIPSRAKMSVPGSKSEVHSGLFSKTAGAASASAASSTAGAGLFSKTAGAANAAAASSTAVSGLFSKTAGAAHAAAASSTAVSGLFSKTAGLASVVAASSTGASCLFSKTADAASAGAASSTAASGLFSKTADTASAAASSTAAAQAANLVQQTYEKVSKEEAAAKREEAIRKNTNSSSKLDKQAKRRKCNGSAGTLLNFGVGAAVNLDQHKSFSRQLKVRRGYSQNHVHATLVRKSRNELHRSLETLNAARAAKAAEKGNSRMNKKVKEQSYDKSTMKATSVGPSTTSKQTPNDKISYSKNEDVEPMTIDVPDPDFHDFDKDRSEKSVSNDDTWATYDEEDGMPRYYAFIQKVISYKPFKVRMSFLASKSTAEFGSLNWTGSGFAKTSGEFRIVRYEVVDTINIFSHKVNYEKGLRGMIKIVPRKGQIWALYRNWSPDWNEHTPDDVIHKYDMVEILEDYNEELGLSVAPLIKVAGFKTVFHRHLDSNKIKKIPREEMFRLSHQVPSYVLTGGEGSGAPKGCYELDPAATPLELLQVFTESKTDEVMHASELLKPEETKTDEVMHASELLKPEETKTDEVMHASELLKREETKTDEVMHASELLKSEETGH